MFSNRKICISFVNTLSNVYSNKFFNLRTMNLWYDQLHMDGNKNLCEYLENAYYFVEHKYNVKHTLTVIFY